MKKIYFAFIILALFILNGCTIEPKGVNFVKLDPPTTIPPIEVDLNFATDTIFIQQNDEVTFSYKLNGDYVRWSKFIIGGTEIATTVAKTGSISMSYYGGDKTPGKTFTLELKILTTPKTGSIADKIDAEGTLISRRWIVVFQDAVGMSSKILKADFVDGRLRIDWNIYKGVGFKNYKLYKRLDSKILVATINSQNQTSFIDSTYHGEQSNYFIVTNDQYYGAGKLVSGPLPVLVASNTTNGDILLKWTKPPYYKNLKGYRISYNDQHYAMQLVGETTGSDIESYVIPNPMFAYNYELYLTPIPLSNNFYDAVSQKMYLSTKATATLGVTSPGYRVARGGLAPISYLLWDPDGITVFDHNTFTTAKILKYDMNLYEFDVSANNKYLVGAPLYYFNKIYFEDLTDPSKRKKLDFTITYPQMGQYVSVSNVGTGVFLNDQSAILYDYIKEVQLAEVKLPHKDGAFGNKISPSGNFFYCDNYYGVEYFQYKDNQIVHLQSGGNIYHAEYLPGNNEKLVRVFYNMIEVVDCNTWTVEKQWPCPVTMAYNVDLKSGKLLLRQGNKLVLFDVMNGTKEELKSLEENTFIGASSLFYNNGQILWDKSRAIR